MNNQKPGLISDTKKSAKNLAQQIARQVAREPLEILKTAGSQTLGTPEASRPQPQNQGQTPQKEGGQPDGSYKEKVKQRDTRLLGALEQEIKEIRMRNNQKEQQIQMAQEQQKQQMLQAQEQNKDLPFIASKPGRKMGAAAQQGQKAAAERQQKNVETRIQGSS